MYQTMMYGWKTLMYELDIIKKIKLDLISKN